ncbi:multidrug transporter [Pedobacter sp. HMWF019]|uniref:HlyD family secretion protein n=1 Tax=Pedobacter sp. HMWF019 TaxID=2056856 RepID=UPI000D39E317|nr:HlyD family secretion protein [Pedobacter sp. HMWF019]PTS92359.1 multidrug transporter [Pedobacter sp. HMWF019]
MNIKPNKIDKIVVKVTRGIAIVVLCGLGLWGISLIRTMLRYQQTNDAQVEEYVNPINAKVGGYIKKICFIENQQVNEGDTLLVIDNSEYRVQQDEAGAALENAKSQTGILEANISTLKSNATIGLSQIDAARAKMVRQQQEFYRYQNLLKEESTTQQHFDNVKTALDIAISEYQAVVNTYKAALSKIKDVEAQKVSVLAEIKRRQYVLNRNKLELGYTVITAPYRGKVGKKVIQEGQLVEAGQTMTFIINEEGGKWIVANFKETQIGKFKAGQKAMVTVDAFPDKEFNGEIESVSPATGSRYSLLPPDNATGNFVKIIQRIPIRIKLTDERSKIAMLSAGMNANVSIKKENHE